MAVYDNEVWIARYTRIALIRGIYARCVRWQRLFEDLESQAAALAATELRGEVAERTRIEVAQLNLGQRLHAALGRDLALRILGGQSVSGSVARWGQDWLLLAGAEEVLVPHRALVAVSGLPSRATASGGIDAVSSRLTLRSALRAIARERSRVIVSLVDGSQATGTPDRVGADWLDLALHDADQAPRRSEVGMRWAIPIGAISAVRRPNPNWA
jgi:hypothetical protein